MLTDVRLQDDGGNGEELSGGRELNAVIQLFPMREESGLALVGRLKRRPFHRVHEHVHPLRGQQDHGHSWGTAAVTIRAKKMGDRPSCMALYWEEKKKHNAVIQRAVFYSPSCG